MVTIIVGKKNAEKSIANIVTICDGADQPARIQFDVSAVEAVRPE